MPSLPSTHQEVPATPDRIEFRADPRGINQPANGPEMHALLRPAPRSARSGYARTLPWSPAPTATASRSPTSDAAARAATVPPSRWKRPHRMRCSSSRAPTDPGCTCSPAPSTSSNAADHGSRHGAPRPVPDAETVVMALLGEIAPTATSTPTPIEPPVMREQRVGGSDNGASDFPRIEVAACGPATVVGTRRAVPSGGPRQPAHCCGDQRWRAARRQRPHRNASAGGTPATRPPSGRRWRASSSVSWSCGPACATAARTL